MSIQRCTFKSWIGWGIKVWPLRCRCVKMFLQFRRPRILNMNKYTMKFGIKLSNRNPSIPQLLLTCLLVGIVMKP